MPRLAIAFAATLLTAVATAQLTIVVPNGCATAAGNTSNAFPWGSGASLWPGLHHMCIYDAANFTVQGVTFPILITRLRWRPNDGAPAYAGGTFTQASVALSTAPIDYTVVTTNFATNHGPDLTTVYSGPVTVPAGNGGLSGTPASWSIDIPAAQPFVYDPANGDLVIDCDYPGGANFVGGPLSPMDVQSTNSLSSRVYASSFYPIANGTTQDHGVVVEISYVPAAGAATSATFGTGCYETATSTFYETFAGGTFDLSNGGFSLLPNGTGYAVLPGTGPWFVPVASNLALANNAVSAAQPLGFPLNYPGGSTTAVFVSSNGFVWAQNSTNHGCCYGNPNDLRQLGARWCPLWADFEPSTLGGGIRFDQDAPNGAAYVTFTNVTEASTSTTSTFQVAFFATGRVEYRYQSCAVGNHVALTGWSPGNGASDPGSIDLSASLPITTSPDLHAPRLTGSARPMLGTNVTLTAGTVPAGSPLGAFLFGLVQHFPGVHLAALGMAGCYQYVSLDATVVFLPIGGTGAYVFVFPNDPSLAGTHVYAQAAAFAPGQNPLGIVSSNGLDLRIGTH